MVLSALLPSVNSTTILLKIVFSITLLSLVERSCWLGIVKGRMQQIRFNYSLKNIGLPGYDEYHRELFHKTENGIKRMRWKAHFYLNGESGKREKKSKQSPPAVPELKRFEDDIIHMTENIKFRHVDDEFMNTLEQDKRKVEASQNVFIFADKTHNIYEMHADKYNKLLKENITKTYKLAQDGTVDKINHDLKNIANELNIGNRMEPATQPQAFISLKDHKDGFENHPKCRLINPAKSDLGKVSKTILGKINAEIHRRTCPNQWRNFEDTITWFDSLTNKDRLSFLSFDIVEFYPSITESLLDRAIALGQQFTAISDSDIRIVKHARKSLLFYNQQAWTKRNNTTTFDVTMGSFDGAEVCELVGLFILKTLEKRFG